jgi:hypothetical protein
MSRNAADNNQPPTAATGYDRLDVRNILSTVKRVNTEVVGDFTVGAEVAEDVGRNPTAYPHFHGFAHLL